MNWKKIKGVIFDLDGVLVDSEFYQSKAWIEALKKYKIFLSQEDLSPYKGKSAEVIERELKKNYHLRIKRGELVRERNKFILKIYKRTKLKLMPYAKSALTFFTKQSKKLGLASTGERKEIFLKLKKLDLISYFSAIVSRNDVKRGKPYPDIYLLAAKKLNLEPKECLALEDTAFGVESAKSAGLFCFAIPNDFSKNQNFSKADKVFKNLKEVIEWIKNEK